MLNWVAILSVVLGNSFSISFTNAATLILDILLLVVQLKLFKC